MRKIWFRFWIILWPIVRCLFFYPINSLSIRAVLFACVIWHMGRMFSFWPSQQDFLCRLFLLTFLIAGFLICPGRNYDRKQLRDAYVHALRSYEGTRYIWGGEDMLGIDCSGLVRAGLIKATFKEGLLTFNPRLARFAVSLWWHDASAEALGQEYRQQTKRLFATSSINELDQNKVVPGDIAVTTSGVHVLAYLGDGEWIEADPNLGKVVIVQVPAEKNPWFQEPVKVLRWCELNVE